LKGEGAQGGWPKTVEFAISHLPMMVDVQRKR